MKNKPFKKLLECHLSKEAFYEKARELAKFNSQKEEIELSKKEVNADFQAQLKKCDLDINRAHKAVSSGKEWRNVECQWKFDIPKNTKTLFRRDTGETINQKEISAEDRQMLLEMDFEKAPKRLEAAPDDSIVNAEVIEDEDGGPKEPEGPAPPPEETEGEDGTPSRETRESGCCYEEEDVA